ncbi:hypothetical protein LTR56_024034 [Elasticomyces elasticus]|nr:hypothetical protein LTR56_024034 [Elasticomyces elasticus]KAK4908440.1 hypothetical protein LTR49_022646 [Elasticomyces elasticus]KAK5743181.1 hypothetical protein LTS12_023954 [Elasticomyces elasticus]
MPFAVTWISDESIFLPPTIPEVFDACGIRRCELGDWENIDFSRLRNMRQSQPEPSRKHTPWQYIPDIRLGLQLPSLEKVLVGIIIQASTRGIGEEAQIYEGNELSGFTLEEWIDWATAVSERRTVPKRILNMSMKGIMGDTERQAFEVTATEIVRRFYPLPDQAQLLLNPADANTTPRLTRTEVHHDSLPHASVAIGRAEGKDEPLKLWLLWPSTEILHLARCYGDTQAAVQFMDHGCFFVQMAGKAIHVPPNSPHAVIALQAGYIVGQTFSVTSGSFVLDPGTVQADVAGGITVEEACETRVKQLRGGLSDKKFRQMYLAQFIGTWFADAEVLRGNKCFDNLVEVWADDIRRTETCAWCEHIIAETGDYVGLDETAHARAHLTGNTRFGALRKRVRPQLADTSDGEYQLLRKNYRRKKQKRKKDL